MNHNDKWFFATLIAALTLLFGAMMLVSAQPASAQCGTSASSCKNCHETQGKGSVANNGDWHKAHAFGDFCEFCHAGNVQAAAQDEAHVGMVAPLGDVKASCQGCHPDDYNPLAQTYASTLGVDLMSGGGGGTQPPADSAPGGDDSCTTGPTAISAPLGDEEIDFNLLYAEATTPPPLISNWGNIILVLMIVGVAAVFFVTAWSWENWGQKAADWINHNISPVPQAMAAAMARSDGGLSEIDPGQVEALLAQKPELQRLLPRLLKLPPEKLAALDALLANPKRSSEILAAIRSTTKDKS